MALKFETPESYIANSPIHLGLFSYNGVGKTTFAGKTGLRTIHIDCSDAGTVSLKGAKNTKVVRVRNPDEYLELVQTVNLKYKDKCDLLVPDTLTGLQSLAIRKIKGKGDMNKRKWGQVSSIMIECIAETSEFPGDIIYLIQEKNKSMGDGDDAYIDIMPSLTPSVREFFSSKVDWIGRLYLDNGDERFLTFLISDDLEVKDRAGLFPKVISKPNYLGVRKRIQDFMKGK